MPLKTAIDADKDEKISKEEFLAGVKKLQQNCKKDEKDLIDEKSLAEELGQILMPPPGFGPPGGAAVSPLGAPLAGVIMKRADKDNHGKLSLDELLAAAETLFTECDKDKNGTLNDEELAAGINLLMPPPEGFRPPGPNPGGGPQGPGGGQGPGDGPQGPARGPQDPPRADSEKGEPKS
jgi:hypothetical protein